MRIYRSAGRWSLLFCLGFIGNHPANAAGRLPRGDAKVLPGKVAAPVADSAVEKSVEEPGVASQPLAGPGAIKPTDGCLADFVQPPGAIGVFQRDGSTFYHMSPIKALDSIPSEPRSRYRYNLHQLNLANRNLAVLAAVDLPEVDAIIPHGTPAMGITGIIWKGDGIFCHSGEANFVTIALDPLMPTKMKEKLQVPRAVQDHGAVHVVESVQYPLLYNLRRRAILELDFGLFQTRHTSMSIPDGEALVFADLEGRNFFTWRPQLRPGAKLRGLTAYRTLGEVDSRLQFNVNDKLLQDGQLFGVAQFDQKSNSIGIKELPKWTGVSAAKDFSLTLPSAYPVAQAEVKINFSKRLVMVGGFGSTAKKAWKRVFLYDYQNGWELGEFKLAENRYVSYGGIDPTGKYAVVAVSHVESGLTEQLLIFSFKIRKWLSVNLPTAK